MGRSKTPHVTSFTNVPDPTNKALLGGKGSSLAIMTGLGLPVPPGFILTTEAYLGYAETSSLPEGIWDQTQAALRQLEKTTSQTFGDPTNPLLVSARSGAQISMPGMMDTVLNIGLNDKTVEGLAKKTNDPQFAYDSYQLLIQMFGTSVLGLPKEDFDDALNTIKKRQGVRTGGDLDSGSLQEVIAEFKAIIQTSGQEFPQDPKDQLYQAIGAVFNSWGGERANAYREANNIPHDLGTAVTIQKMVFGNTGGDSGTGVLFTRDPETGEERLYGNYLPDHQGEAVVNGTTDAAPIERLETSHPDIFGQIQDIAEKLEGHFKEVQDIEFTVENGTVWMLQTRNAQKTAEAAVRFATDMVNESLITKEEAVLRVTPAQVEQLLSAQFDQKAKKQAIDDGKLLTTGVPASPGAAVGEVVFDAETALRRSDELQKEGDGNRVILVRPETLASDYEGMIAAAGILTARGGKTSHAAVVARGSGIPAVVGASDMVIDLEKHQIKIDGRVVKEGETISFDGLTGEVIAEELPIGPKRTLPELPELSQLLEWADEIARLQVWANADNPEGARRSLEAGAQGIGLCRTEHMFVGDERLTIFRKAIMAEDRKTYLDLLEQLGGFQKEDFQGILKEMNGLPVIIRLLDPPLHEFLPDYTELRVKKAHAEGERAPKKVLDSLICQLENLEQYREADPMMGLRGIRLGITQPDIYEMQVRAIVEAAIDNKQNGGDPKPKIMIPLVSGVKELRYVKKLLEDVAKNITRDQDTQVDYKIGVMIETPRAALTAHKLAQVAEFFSFGTNDLTQATYMFSRDDAEGSFLPQYLEDGIVQQSPFQTFDSEGVGRLIQITVEDGRAVKPDISIGVCGEHGGDPESITFFDGAGLDYVSASPDRIPIARLAAAQATLAAREQNGTETK